MQRDQLYETARHLDLNTLRHLCQTNKLYYEICKEERFKRLIRQRYDEMILNKVNNMINRLKNSKNMSAIIRLNLYRGPDANRFHEIEFFRDYRGVFYITEDLKNLDYTDSIIYRYVKKVMNFKGFENITPEEYEDFVNDPRLIKSHYSDFPLISDIDYLLQKVNLTLYGTNQNSFYNVKEDSFNPLVINANNVQPKSLKDMVTMMYKLYPNATETYSN